MFVKRKKCEDNEELEKEIAEVEEEQAETEPELEELEGKVKGVENEGDRNAVIYLFILEDLVEDYEGR